LSESEEEGPLVYADPLFAMFDSRTLLRPLDRAASENIDRRLVTASHRDKTAQPHASLKDG